MNKDLEKYLLIVFVIAIIIVSGTFFTKEVAFHASQLPIAVSLFESFAANTDVGAKFSWPDTTEDIHLHTIFFGGDNPSKAPTQSLLNFIANKYDIIDNLNYEQVKEAKAINPKPVYLRSSWEANGLYINEQGFAGDPKVRQGVYYDNPSPQKRSFNNVVVNRWFWRAPTNPAVIKDAYIQYLVEHLNKFGENGIRADLVDGDIRRWGGLMSITSTNSETAPEVWPVYDYFGNPYDQSEYAKELVSTLTEVKAALGPGKPLIFNGDVLSLMRLGFTDGVNFEGYFVSIDEVGDHHGRVVEYEGWKGQIANIREAEKRNVAQLIIGVFSGTLTAPPEIAKRRVDTPEAIKARLFSLGSYLLAKGKQTYFYYDTHSFYEAGPKYFPEWKIKIGKPLKDCDTADQCKLSNGLYGREFSKGMVVINPYDTGASISMQIPAGFSQAILRGGNDPELPFERGSLDTPGSIEYRPVNSITLGPKDAVILVKSTNASALSISQITPSSGQVETPVTITGTNFTPTNNTVIIGTNQYSGLASPDGRTISGQIPPELAPGTYQVSVSNANGKSNKMTITVEEAPGPSAEPYVHIKAGPSLNPAASHADDPIAINPGEFVSLSWEFSDEFFLANNCWWKGIDLDPDSPVYITPTRSGPSGVREAGPFTTSRTVTLSCVHPTYDEDGIPTYHTITSNGIVVEVEK